MTPFANDLGLRLHALPERESFGTLVQQCAVPDIQHTRLNKLARKRNCNQGNYQARAIACDTATLVPLLPAADVRAGQNGTRRSHSMKLARVCFLLLPLFALTAQAQLGSAGMFGVLGASAVTNTGPTVVDGDLGVYPGTSITGFPPGIVNGTIYDGDAVAMQAQSDALAAYNFFAGLSSNENLSGTGSWRPRAYPGSLYLQLLSPADGGSHDQLGGVE